MGLIDVAQGRDERRALVKMVVNLRAPENAGKILEWLHNWRLLKNDSAP
jgi:hypothetical protein